MGVFSKAKDEIWADIFGFYASALNFKSGTVFKNIILKSTSSHKKYPVL